MRPISAAFTLVAALLAAAPLAADGLSGPYLAARQADQQNAFEEAAQYYAEATNEDRNNAFLLQNAILHAVIAGEFDQAVHQSERLSDLGADMQLGGLVLVADAIRQGAYPRAARLLDDEALRLNPLLSGLLKGWVAAGQGEATRAATYFDALGEDTAFGTLGDYHKALMMGLVGNFEAAVEILEGEEGEPLRVNRASARAHAEALVQLERRDEALAVIEAAQGTFPDPGLAELSDAIRAGDTVPFSMVTNPQDGAGEVFLTLATALDREDAGRFALLYGKLAQVVRPSYVDALILTADLFEAVGQYDLAVEDYAAIPVDASLYRSAEVGRANALSSAGRPDEAINALTSLSLRFPDDRFVHVARGDMLRQAERYSEAADAYSAALDIENSRSADDWRTLYVRGIAFERMDLWDMAERDFRAALAINPDQALVLNYLGYSLVEKRMKIDEARGMIERAVELQPDDGYITDSLGWVLYRLGDFDGAVAPMERAAELLPTDPIINDHLGDVYYKVGRKTEAVFQWKRALSFEPEPEEAERIRKKLDVGLDAVLAEEDAAE